MILSARRAAAISVRRARAVRCLAIIGLLAAVLSACGSASAAPLVFPGDQGAAGCIPAPDPLAGIPRWDSPAGFALDMYYNQSVTSAVTIKSLSLIDSHNLVLHGGVVYENAHSRHFLPYEAGWGSEGRYAQKTAWARRQPIRGAVIPRGHPSKSSRELDTTTNLYEVVADVSDATPGGGWALGEKVRYQAGGRTYTITAETGMAIGSALVPIAKSCDGQLKDINAALK